MSEIYLTKTVGCSKKYSIKFIAKTISEMYLKRISENACQACRMRLKDCIENNVQPYGYSCMIVCEEGTLAFHTDLSAGESYCEFETTDEIKFELFKNILEGFDVEILKEEGGADG